MAKKIFIMGASTGIGKALAINYAENGFPVTELVSYYLERSSEIFAAYPNFKDVWMPNGKTPKKGEIFINKNLAENYKEIANTYGKSFYSGKIAENIVNTVNAQGGFSVCQI